MTTEETKTGKVWTSWATFIRDHTRFMVELPGYLAAYLWPGRSLDPITLESVMLTVNSVNTCPYCTGLHGQLARMAGAEPDAQAPAVKYATTFAHEAGRGADERAAFESLSKELGPRKASSVRSLCWALLWGKTTGNSINSTRSKLLSLDLMSLTALEALRPPLRITVAPAHCSTSAVAAIGARVRVLRPPLPRDRRAQRAAHQGASRPAVGVDPRWRHAVRAPDDAHPPDGARQRRRPRRLRRLTRQTRRPPQQN
mmetsp:Transcript_11383/g.36024  ORF Transcript_11383/g.36024 Transcript_11383/m.36024 type:complete len:256 (-) Transcript_11383:134-901(-)